MANVSPQLRIPFTVGTGQIVGQGNEPEAWCLYTTDDASNTSPVWIDATSKLRAFNPSHGRDSALSEFSAGTCSLTVDNRTRIFDPNSNAAIRPMNRWWLREQFSGETHDLFKGYAESYDNQWPTGGWSDAECIVSCSDEFKVLSLAALPSTSILAQTYEDTIKNEQPTGYWRHNELAATYVAKATIGQDLVMTDNGGGLAFGNSAPGVVAGDLDGFQIFPGGLTPMSTLTHTLSALGDVGECGLLTEFTIEFWFKLSQLPSATRTLVLGPGTTGVAGITYKLTIDSQGMLAVQMRTEVTTYTATAAVGIGPNTWYHIVGTVISNNLSLFINGVLVSAVTRSGSFLANDMASSLGLWDSTESTVQGSYDETVFYRRGLPAANVLAHYQAAQVRGFVQQTADQRISAALTAIGSATPRSLQAGVRAVQARFTGGGSPLDMIREAVSAEAVDAAFFTAADGSLRFLASNHRSSSPYNTSQAIFGDAGGAEIAYLDVNVDYSDSFLTNEWNVSRADPGAQTQTASDATSIARYFKRSQSLSNLALTSDADALTVANAMLAKYKDPMQRITSISFNTLDPAVTEAVFRREVMDKITVKRTPPGGGSRVSQDLYIQKITVNGDNSQNPWTITWDVSPL